MKLPIKMFVLIFFLQNICFCQNEQTAKRRRLQTKTDDAKVSSDDRSNFVSVNFHLEIEDREIKLGAGAFQYKLIFSGFEKSGAIQFTDYKADLPFKQFPVNQKGDLKIEILDKEAVKFNTLEKDFVATTDAQEAFLTLIAVGQIQGDDDDDGTPSGDPVKDLFLTLPAGWTKYQDAYNIDTIIIGLIPSASHKFVNQNVNDLDEPYFTFYVKEQASLEIKQIFVNDAKIEKEVIEKKIGDYTWKILETSKGGYYVTSFLMIYKSSTYYGYCRSNSSQISTNAVLKFLENLH